jgi:hypothetical protein
MKEFMYDISSITIAVTMFFSMALVIELGYRLGRWSQARSDEIQRSHTGAIQGSLLGILALLLGFTFSIALNRHDSRSEAVVNEANAIGTTLLRAQLLPQEQGESVRKLLQQYTDLRVQASAVSTVDEADRDVLLARTAAIVNELWALARAAAMQDPNPVTTGLFIQSLNEMIDSFGRRDAALARHVPETVLFLLYGTFLMTSCVVGFTAGLTGHRTSFVTYIMIGLIVVLVFIIVDLDRPRRGLIQVNQHSMLVLQQSLNAQVP